MRTTITVRGIDPGDKSWLKHEAHLTGVSMEEFVRRLIRVDLVLTDPPFFDNVHYSELADFFYAWQQLTPRGFINGNTSTRVKGEVQDTDSAQFAVKLRAVFLECNRDRPPIVVPPTVLVQRPPEAWGEGR